ncbi:TRAP transporter small permease [Effusibacillus lacus]|uniref:C4-dicarboxylate ABC transporter permease n=1 Tax=Effusibacillus lacus TaxID=1348429 RepID=A0A292YLY0_9BACL|nr:TRAP transporter small permease [Effusibacillus lacus]GAX90176.1 C4-dicarboxylate ABC transporter permease [Effusibacillus lacus]
MGVLVSALNRIMRFLVNILLFAMVMAVFLQVLFRFLIDQPLAWTEELARYLLIWITFLGSAYAMSVRAHIGTDYILNYLSPGLKKIVLVLGTAASCLFFGIMAIEGYTLAMRGMVQTSPTLQLPMGLVYSVIPISGALLIVNLLHVAWQDYNRIGGDQ